jgi:hypothetical protein
MSVVSESANYHQVIKSFTFVKKGVVARAEQRQSQRWVWMDGRWLVPDTLPKHQLKAIT